MNGAEGKRSGSVGKGRTYLYHVELCNSVFFNCHRQRDTIFLNQHLASFTEIFVCQQNMSFRSESSLIFQESAIFLSSFQTIHWKLHFSSIPQFFSPEKNMLKVQFFHQLKQKLLKIILHLILFQHISRS